MREPDLHRRELRPAAGRRASRPRRDRHTQPPYGRRPRTGCLRLLDARRSPRRAALGSGDTRAASELPTMLHRLARPRVIIARGALDQIERETVRAAPLETGGVLAGYVEPRSGA